MTNTTTSDDGEDYLQPLGHPFAQILEENFWDLVLKSDPPNEEESV